MGRKNLKHIRLQSFFEEEAEMEQANFEGRLDDEPSFLSSQIRLSDTFRRLALSNEA